MWGIGNDTDSTDRSKEQEAKALLNQFLKIAQRKIRIMAFIGRQSGNIGNYVRCNTITTVGSTTTFDLTNVLDNVSINHCFENNVICSVSRSYSRRLQHSQLINKYCLLSRALTQQMLLTLF